MRPYTRSLDPADYAFLPQTAVLRTFESMMTAPHCLWHEYKLWENASILQQLDELNVPHEAQIIDIGSGGMFFPVFLASEGGYPNLTLTDSMAARDLTAMIEAQRVAYGVALPLLVLKAEEMSAIPSETYDVTMCISTIEHVDADRHDDALREICRITKSGGLIFITSDYFRSDVYGQADPVQRAASPYRDGQLTAYCQELVVNLPRVIDADFVGGTDLTYRGDFVHNYSFVNICMRKR